MKTYCPMANTDPKDKIINDTLFTYNSCVSLEQAFRAIRCWKDDYHYTLIKAWVDVFEDGELVDTIYYRVD